MTLTEKAELLTAQYEMDKEKGIFSEEFKLRTHRALSWLRKAGQCNDDHDMMFINLWIAFNAAYANEIGGNTGDKSSFHQFLYQICHLDEEQKRIYDLLWHKFSGSIRLLLDNRYVYQSFWEYQNGNITEYEWDTQFQRAKDAAYFALKQQNTVQMLGVLFNLLYTLRNQIIHGGATYNSSANRHQVKDACNILEMLIPTIVEIMLENHDKFNGWGKPFYPLIEN